MKNPTVQQRCLRLTIDTGVPLDAGAVSETGEQSWHQ